MGDVNDNSGIIRSLFDGYKSVEKRFENSSVCSKKVNECPDVRDVISNNIDSNSSYFHYVGLPFENAASIPKKSSVRVTLHFKMNVQGVLYIIRRECSNDGAKLKRPKQVFLRAGDLYTLESKSLVIYKTTVSDGARTMERFMASSLFMFAADKNNQLSGKQLDGRIVAYTLETEFAGSLLTTDLRRDDILRTAVLMDVEKISDWLGPDVGDSLTIQTTGAVNLQRLVTYLTNSRVFLDSTEVYYTAPFEERTQEKLRFVLLYTEYYGGLLDVSKFDCRTLASHYGLRNPDSGGYAFATLDNAPYLKLYDGMAIPTTYWKIISLREFVDTVGPKVNRYIDYTDPFSGSYVTFAALDTHLQIVGNMWVAFLSLASNYRQTFVSSQDLDTVPIFNERVDVSHESKKYTGADRKYTPLYNDSHGTMWKISNQTQPDPSSLASTASISYTAHSMPALTVTTGERLISRETLFDNTQN